MPKTAIQEGIDETKEQLKAAEEREQKEMEDAVKADDKPAEAEGETPAAKVEEKPEQKPEPEVAAEEEKPKSPAQLRVEKRKRETDLAEQLVAARAKIAELERPAPKTEPEEVAPSREDDPVAYAEHVAKGAAKAATTALERLEKIEKNENTRAAEQRTAALENAAKSELFQMENVLKQQLPDYDDVKAHYVKTLAFSFKSLNRNLTDQQLVQAVDAKIYADAIKLYEEGYENPVHALYDRIKADGYTPSKATEKEEKLKPDLDKVAKNKARNAGTVAAAAGTGSGEVTARFAATEMTTAEVGKLFATMSPQEKKNFYQNLR